MINSELFDGNPAKDSFAETGKIFGRGKAPTVFAQRDGIRLHEIDLDRLLLGSLERNLVVGALSHMSDTYGSAMSIGDSAAGLHAYTFQQNTLTGGQGVFYVQPNGDLIYLGNLSFGIPRSFSLPERAKFLFADQVTGVIIGATRRSPPAGQTIVVSAKPAVNRAGRWADQTCRQYLTSAPMKQFKVS